MAAPKRCGLPARGLPELDVSESVPTPDNTPSSVYGGLLQVVFDEAWGHNIKTGSSVPAVVLAEVDRKTDDGAAG